MYAYGYGYFLTEHAAFVERSEKLGGQLHARDGVIRELETKIHMYEKEMDRLRARQV